MTAETTCPIHGPQAITKNLVAVLDYLDVRQYWWLRFRFALCARLGWTCFVCKNGGPMP